MPAPLYNQRLWLCRIVIFAISYRECDSLNAHMPHQHGQGQPQGPQPLPGVDAIIAVGSGKGGVGKTTLSVNLAVSLVKMGYKVGLLDADVYGPNVPLMLGVSDQPRMVGENRIEPIQAFGLKVISVGFLNPGDKPIIWRGPMLHQIVRQFLGLVEWGQLDYLIVDLPPGTGDIALSLVQTVPLTGAVVVSTPSDVSLQDARKAVEMFRQMKVDIVGVVENMSYSCAPTASTKSISSRVVAPKRWRRSSACRSSAASNSILKYENPATAARLWCWKAKTPRTRSPSTNSRGRS